MSDSTTILRATLDDIPRLAPLFDGYRMFYKQASDLEGAKAFLSKRLATDESVIFLAFHVEKPAGFTQLYPLFSSVRMARVWLLNDLFVHPDFRRKAIARALMLMAIKHARETEYRGIELSTDVSNHQAQALYEDLGFAREEGYYTYSLSL
ncbi:MAG: GNAT family N-acetyltransferase [Planctomycetota bacterium]|nr:GNAT family N-acetyltransferase [Planctomycetota bacterium]